MTILRIGAFTHASYCQRCVYATAPDMLTGYCLTACHCDRCGALADLAMVRWPEAGAKSECPGCALCCRGCAAEKYGEEPEPHTCDASRHAQPFKTEGEIAQDLNP